MPVRRAWRAGFKIVLVPAVLKKDDRDAGGARRIKDLLGLSNSGGGAADIEAGDIDIAALAGVGVLHIDYDDCRLIGLQRQWLRACGQRNKLAVSWRLIACANLTAHQTASFILLRWLRDFINGWMRSPKFSTPLTKSSKVSRTPSAPGTVATSSSMRATLA